MLESLTLKGFQKHKCLKIEFDPRITTLVGRTGTGKSGAFRGLKQICLNHLRTTRHITWGLDKCTLILRVDNRKIGKIRTESRNLYRIEGNPQPYRAFGVGVPEDISSILRVSEESFQSQISIPFWLAESGPQVAKNLNSIVSLEVIDETLSALATEARKARHTVQVNTSRLLQVEKEYSKLQYVPSLHQELGALEKKEKSLQEKKLSIARLRGILATLTSTRSLAKDSQKRLLETRKVYLLCERARAIQEKREALEKLLKELEISSRKRILKLPDFSYLEKKRKTLETLKLQKNSLSSLVSSLELSLESRKDLTTRLREEENKLGEYLKDYGCPVCERVGSVAEGYSHWIRQHGAVSRSAPPYTPTGF